MTRRQRTPAQREKGWRCEWGMNECGCQARFRDSNDYVSHVIAKHQNGAEPAPDCVKVPR